MSDMLVALYKVARNLLAFMAWAFPPGPPRLPGAKRPRLSRSISPLLNGSLLIIHIFLKWFYSGPTWPRKQHHVGPVDCWPALAQNEEENQHGLSKHAAGKI